MAAVGKWAQARAVGNANALSTASGLVRAQPEVSSCPPLRAAASIAVAAPDLLSLRAQGKWVSPRSSLRPS